jgi:predicted acylesterase/phospholipase RssA
MNKNQRLTPLEAVNEIRNNDHGQVVLVLQGGGALGAYQGGVYQALHDAGIEPDWLIGTSIGAINASIIAGNKVEDRLPRLQEFWRRMEYSTYGGVFPAWTGIAEALSSWTTLTSGIPGFFEANMRAFLGAHVPLGVDHAGFYSTEPLRQTLEELVDFSRINQDHPRLSRTQRCTCPGQGLSQGAAMMSVIFCALVSSLPNWLVGASFFAPVQAAHRNRRGYCRRPRP